MYIGDECSLLQCNIPKIKALIDHPGVDMKLYGVDIGGCSKISTYPETGHVEYDIDLAERLAECFEDVVGGLRGVIYVILVIGEVVLLISDVDLN